MKILFLRKIYLPIFFMVNLFAVLCYDHNFNFSLILSILLFVLILGEKIFYIKVDNSLLEPDFVFYIIFLIFHFSYIWLYFFGFADYNREVFFNIDKVPLSIYFCNFCVAFFYMGYGHPTRNIPNYKMHDSYNFIIKSYYYSKILISLCLIFFWLPLLTTGNGIFTDYKLLISVGKLSYFGKLYFVGQFLAVGSLSLYCLSSCFLYNRYMAGRFRFIALFYIGSYLIIGDRGGFVCYAIIPALCYNLFQKKITFKTFLPIIIILLAISSYVAVSRTQSIFNPFLMVATYHKEKKESPLLKALNEYGSSLKTVVIAMDLVPCDYKYWYGKSYLRSLSIALPNIFHKKRSSNKSPGTWLTETAFGSLDKTYGRGGSIAMEAYLNFGFWFGSFSFVFLGLFLKKIYKSFLIKTNIIYGVLYLSMMSVFTLWIRNTSSVAPRTLIWSFILVILVKNMPKLRVSKRITTITS